MHPIRTLKKKIKVRCESRKLDREVQEFIAEIDTHVRVFELDPELPEIQEIRRDAKELLSGSNKDYLKRAIIARLNPYKDVTVGGGGHVTLHERWFGHVLQAWSLVEFHLPHFEVDAFTRIRVDESGTRVYAFNDRRESVHFRAGVLDPYRMADPGNRVQNAAAFVDHFTGLELLASWEELHRYKWIEVKKQEDGSWVVEYDPEPAYA